MKKKKAYYSDKQILEKVSSKLGNYKDYHPEYRFASCYFCDGSSSNPPFSINIENGKYFCQHCKNGGDLSKLSIFDGKIKRLKNKKTKKNTKDKSASPAFIWDNSARIKKNSDSTKYLKKRGISWETLKKLPIKENGSWQCLIPMTNKEKEIVAINSRFKSPETPEIKKRYKGKKSLGVSILKEGENVIVAEGLVTGLSVLEKNEDKDMGLIICGDATNLASLAKKSKRWVLKDKKKVLICGDNDSSGVGQKAALQVYSAFPDKSFLKIPLKENSDWNDVLLGNNWEEEWNL